MRVSPRLLLLVLALVVVGGGVFAFRLWREQRVQALAITSLPAAMPDFTRWPAEFKQRVENATQDVGLVKDPVEPLGELARLYQVNGFAGEAGGVLAALRELDPRNPRWPYYLADVRLKARDQAAARRLLEETVALAPGYAPAHRTLAELKAQAGDQQGAAESRGSAEKAMDGRANADPWITELGWYCYDAYRLQILAEGLLTARDAATAITMLQRAVEIAPTEALFHDMLASAYEATGQLDGAKRSLQNGLKRAPQAHSLHVRLAVVLCQMRQVPEAIDVLQRALRQWPEQAELHAALGHSLLIARRPAEAVEAFKAALARNDRLTEAHFNLANSYIQLGRRAEAKTSYQRAVELRPDYADALAPLGQLAIEDGDAEAAERYATALIAVRQDPIAKRTLAGAKLLKAAAAADGERWMEAERYYRDGLAADPSLPVLHAGAGMVYARTGRMAEAAAAFDAYLHLAPEALDGYMMLGQTLYETGRRDEARQAFVRGYELATRQENSAAAAEFARLKDR